MISLAPQSGVIHLVSVPSAMPNAHSLGRIVPAMLCAKALEHGHTPPGRVILIGDSSCESQAKLLGLEWDLRLAPPIGEPRLLRRKIKKLTKDGSRVICWNDELAELLPGIQTNLNLMSTLPSQAPSYVSKRVDILAFEPGDRDHWIDRGNSVTLDTLLPPLLDNIAESARSISRSAMGIEPQTMCIGALADRPSDVDARELAFLLGLLNASGYNLTGIVPETASHLAAARRHHRGLGSRFHLLVASDPITTLLPAFDALIHPCFDSSGSSMLIERMCENADVPVLRLNQTTRAGLSRAPGVAGPIIEQLDEMIANNSNQTQQTKSEPTHD